MFALNHTRRRDAITPDEAVTLAGLFQRRVSRTPDNLAYRQYDAADNQWHDSTWAEMGQEVARWQAALATERLNPGDRVAVMLNNCREWVMFDQAALGLGLVVVPLYTDDRAENVAYILQNAGARILLPGNQDHWDLLEPVRDELGFLQRLLSVQAIDHNEPRLQCLRDWLPPAAPGEMQVVHADPDALATIVYTSGTTGRPKGVMLSHRNILANAWAAQQRVNIYPDDLFLSFLPLSHTLERSIGYYLTVMCGAAVAFNRAIPLLGEDLLAIRPTVMISVPRIFERVYNKIQLGLEEKSPLARNLFHQAVAVGWRRFEHRQGRAAWHPSLLLWPLLNKLVAGKVMAKLGGRMRLAVCGGAPLSPAIAEVFIGLGLPLVQGYGLTESSPVIAANSIEDNIPASIGTALEGVEVRIGEGDELLARGPNIMLGYWANAEATHMVIDDDGWLHTGDQVRRDESGHLYITGRLKEILVLANGEKVPPADMEQAITMDSLFEQVMVIGDNRPFLTALMVFNEFQWPCIANRLNLNPEDPDSLDSPALHQLVLERISRQIREFPGYAQIRRVHCLLQPWSVDNGMMTPTMKLKRHRIEKQFSDTINRLYQGH